MPSASTRRSMWTSRRRSAGRAAATAPAPTPSSASSPKARPNPDTPALPALPRRARSDPAPLGDRPAARRGLERQVHRGVSGDQPADGARDAEALGGGGVRGDAGPLAGATSTRDQGDAPRHRHRQGAAGEPAAGGGSASTPRSSGSGSTFRRGPAAASWRSTASSTGHRNRSASPASRSRCRSRRCGATGTGRRIPGTATAGSATSRSTQ